MLVLLNFLIYEYYIAYLRECQYIYYKRIVEQKKESIFWTYFDENDGSDDGKSGPAEGRKTRDGTA